MKVYEFDDELGAHRPAYDLWLYEFLQVTEAFFFFLPLSIKVKKTTDFFFAPSRAILSYLSFTLPHMMCTRGHANIQRRTTYKTHNDDDKGLKKGEKKD